MPDMSEVQEDRHGKQRRGRREAGAGRQAAVALRGACRPQGGDGILFY